MTQFQGIMKSASCGGEFNRISPVEILDEDPFLSAHDRSFNHALVTGEQDVRP